MHKKAESKDALDTLGSQPKATLTLYWIQPVQGLLSAGQITTRHDNDAKTKEGKSCKNATFAECLDEYYLSICIYG
jgi:hypothetical protein